VLYGRYDLLDQLTAYKVRPAPKDPPGKFETGTGNIEGMCGSSRGARIHRMGRGDVRGRVCRTLRGGVQRETTEFQTGDERHPQLRVRAEPRFAGCPGEGPRVDITRGCLWLPRWAACIRIVTLRRACDGLTPVSSCQAPTKTTQPPCVGSIPYLRLCYTP